MSSLVGIPHAVWRDFPFGKEINEKKKKSGKNTDKKGGRGHIRSDKVDCKIKSITREKEDCIRIIKVAVHSKLLYDPSTSNGNKNKNYQMESN